MVSSKEKPSTISEYIRKAPKSVQPKLRELLKCVRTAAPGAEENLKWSMPALSYKRILLTFAVFKNHIGFYPTPSAVKAFEKKLTNLKTAKGSIQFPLDKPLPLPLIHEITRFRVTECIKEDKKWKSPTRKKPTP